MKTEEDGRRSAELQQKNQEEIKKQKLFQEEERKERERLEKDILSHISNLKWIKSLNKNNTNYEAVYHDGKKIEFCVTTIVNKNQKREKSFSLMYNHKDFYCMKYKGDKILHQIEAELKRIKKAERRKRKAERKKLEEARLKAAEEERRIRLLEQEERMRRREAEQLGTLIDLPQIGTKDFLVRRAVFKCMHSKHTVEDLDAAVKVVGDDGKVKLVKISAGYFKQCKIYFIMESTYEKLRNMGVVLCRISDEKTYMKNSWVNGMQLAQESILMQFGYTVSQTEGLTATRRQKILAVMIDNKIISKSEIISYLDFFISQRQNQSKYELAVSKWEEDREFVQGYNVGHYTQFGVNAIYRRN